MPFLFFHWLIRIYLETLITCQLNKVTNDSVSEWQSEKFCRWSLDFANWNTHIIYYAFFLIWCCQRSMKHFKATNTEHNAIYQVTKIKPWAVIDICLHLLASICDHRWIFVFRTANIEFLVMWFEILTSITGWIVSWAQFGGCFRVSWLCCLCENLTCQLYMMLNSGHV